MYAPPNYGKDYAAKFNAIYPDLAKQYGVPLYPFFLDGVATVARLTQPDGLHPTAEGIDAIVSQHSAGGRGIRPVDQRAKELKNRQNRP